MEQSNTNLTGNFKELKRLFMENGIPKQDIDDLKSFIEDDSVDRINKKFGKKVSNWIGKVYKRAIDGSWKIDPAKGAGLLAESIAAYYGF